jgi:hypothetical protein
MKPTGRKNPLGEEIFEIEESDINFWENEWEDLSLDQKADFCSFIKMPYLATSGEFNNEHVVKSQYRYWRFNNKNNPQLNVYG